MTRSGGIARYLLLLFCVAALVPLLGLGIAALVLNQDALKLETRSRYLALAAVGAGLVDKHIDLAKRELAAIAELVSAKQIPEADVVPMVASRIASTEAFDFVTLYNTQGRRQGTIKSKDVADPATPESLTEKQKPLEGKYVFGAVVGAGAKLSVTVVFRAQTEPAAYFLTQVRLAPLTAAFEDLGLRLGAAQNASLVSRQHEVLVGAQNVAGENGVFSSLPGSMDETAAFAVATDFTDRSGKSWVGAIEALGNTPFVVVVQEPAERAFWSMTWLRIWLGAALLSAMALAALVSFRGSKSITQPIAQLVSATEEMGARTFVALQEPVVSRSDEFGGLARSFNSMAKNLKTSEEKVKRELEVRASLSRYLPSELVEQVVKNPEQLGLGGTSKEVTVLFADVVGFTQLSETLPPETVVKLLNEHFTVATEIVHKHGGIVDKYIGDCVMAVWGAITKGPDDAERALQAAEDMRRWLDIGNERWSAEYGIHLQIAIGIHAGRAVVGNLGSEKRMEFTVIGDVVNVAARLESIAQPGQILVSAALQARLKEKGHSLQSLGEQHLKGRKTSILTYEVPH
jgi:adenylate cyclase